MLELVEVIKALRAVAYNKRHRVPLVISGSESWVYDTCKTLVAELQATGLHNSQIIFQTGKTRLNESARTIDHPSKLLGVEADGFILNAFEGFNPDVFGLAAGIVKAGGLFILLSPDFQRWPDYVDPDYARLAVYPNTAASIKGRFIERFAKETGLASGVFHIDEFCGWVRDAAGGLAKAADSPVSADEPQSSEDCWRQDQSKLVEKLKTLHAGKILVLTADRGRGKTSALGLAAGEILKENADSSIVVTAPLRANVDPLFQFAQEILKLEKSNANKIENGQGGSLTFFPPDELLRVKPSCQLLLVDEAAAIPPALLMRLTRLYKKIVFSTTVYGYEGCGRGFEIRFLEALSKERPGWMHETLSLPVRWGREDPLEGWVFRALMLRPIKLNEKNASNTKSSENNLPQLESAALPLNVGLTINRVHQSELLENEKLLSDIFYLLVDAHYRTTPSDLRDLLDGLNFSIWVARSKNEVLGVLLIAEEGGLDDAIMAQIYEGKRRPRGHLLPQAIISQLGVTGVKSHFARVVRIAVSPEVRKLGIGAQLMAEASNCYKALGFKFIGSMFGASKGLVHFWSKLGFLPTRLGYSKQASSGEYSLMVLKPLQQFPQVGFAHNEVCLTLREDVLATTLNERFRSRMLVQLADEFSELDADFVIVLLKYPANSVVQVIPLPLWMKEEIEAFINRRRYFQACSSSIYHLALIAFTAAISRDELSVFQQKLIIYKLFQKRTIPKVVQLLELSGKKEFDEALRVAVSELYSSSLASADSQQARV